MSVVVRYDYRCTNCDHTVQDVVKSPDDTAPIVCPGCDERAMKRDIVANLATVDLNATRMKRDRKWPIASNSLPAYVDGCEKTPEGQPIITSRRHAHEVAARNGFRFTA
jgi:putative FmdB family regulatory protein